METFSRYVVSQSSSGGKFWEVLVEDAQLSIRYGKLGQDKSWASKDCGTYAAALKQANKKLQGKLRKGYSEAPRPVVVREIAGLKLAETAFAGVFHLRAHDRYPGGNADIITTKVTFLHVPGQPPTLCAESYRNWDGEHWVYGEVPVELPLEQTLPAFLECAQALIDAGQTDGSFCILDNRPDREEYDTEWSSLEFALTVLPAGSADLSGLDRGETVLQFRQKAVYRGSTPAPPDPVSQAFLDSAMAHMGIGRPEEYSENNCIFTKVARWEGVSQGPLCVPVPMYL